MRLKILLPLVLGAVALVAFAVPTMALWSTLRTPDATPEAMARLGVMVSVGFAAAFTAFALAWGLLHLLVQKPLQALARDAVALANTPQERPLRIPRHHALDRMPGGVETLARRLLAARADTSDQIKAATRRAEEQRSRLEAILVDLNEGVIVCNLDHRILLYNQAAARILDMRESLGLGRPLFGLLTSEPLLHMLEQLTREGEAAGSGAGNEGRSAVGGEPAVDMGHEPRRFVSATLDLGTLLETRVSLVREAGGRASGYVLTFADVGAALESLALRDMILREVMVDWRRPLANLTAASETLADDDGLTAADRAAFLDIVAKEVAHLNTRFHGSSRAYERIAADPWPMADVHSLDLLRAVQKHLQAQDGLDVTLVGVPIWLHADSHSLMLAIEEIARHITAATGERRLDLEARGSGARAYIELSWEGHPVASADLETWLDTPLPGTIANRTIRQIVERHGSELWSEAAAGGRSLLRFPLRAASRPRGRGAPWAQPAQRPEFYDFDLFEEAHAELAETPLRRLTFVVFDTETTGLRPSDGDELISVGAIRVVNGRVLTGETFERLINPGRGIPMVSQRIHGISEDMVRDKPPVRIVLPQFKQFAGESVLVAYNAAFDMKFLELKEDEAGVRFDNPVLDALLLAIHLFKDAPDHSLNAMAAHLGIEIAGRHTALGDAMMTAAVWVRLLDHLEASGVRTFGEAVRISSRMMHERRLSAKF